MNEQILGGTGSISAPGLDYSSSQIPQRSDKLRKIKCYSDLKLGKKKVSFS